MKLVAATRITAVASATALAVLLTLEGLAPQLAALLEAVGLHSHAGYALAFTILAAAAVAGASNTKDVALARALWALTVCVALVRVAVVLDGTQAAASVYEAQAAAVRSAYEADRATYDAAVDARAETIRAAKADPDINAKAPYLQRKAQARQRLAEALAIPVPAKPALQLPPRPATSWLDVLVQVVGPAGTEAVTAFLIKSIGSRIGAAWAFLLAPVFVRRREEVVIAADALAVSESALAEAEDTKATAEAAAADARADAERIAEELMVERARVWAMAQAQVDAEASAAAADEARRAKRRAYDKARRERRKQERAANIVAAAARFRVVQ